MRLRNDPKIINLLYEPNNYFIEDVKPYKNNWELAFKKQQPLHIEIGMGKGNFIIQKAIANPHINYLGIEKHLLVTAIAFKKMKALDKPLDNLKIINFDASDLESIFKPKSISKIYLNFSDPWPKKRHEKNRLTNLKFQNIYRKILMTDAIVEFKTDNNNLYTYSLETLQLNQSVKILYFNSDIYSDFSHQYNIANVQTEYEKKFHDLHVTIKKIVFKYL